MATGIVKSFDRDEGWGVIGSDELPSGHDAFVHFSAIEMTGYRALSPGAIVEFDVEEAQQDAFRFRATSVRLPEST